MQPTIFFKDENIENDRVRGNVFFFGLFVYRRQYLNHVILLFETLTPILKEIVNANSIM